MPKQYLKIHELQSVRRGRDAGTISFFRVESCLRCGTETWKGVPYCSKLCYLIGKEFKMNEGKKWDVVLSRLIGTRVILETLDGMLLRGKFTKVEMYKFKVDNEEVMLPASVCLDNDVEKVIEVSRIAKLTSESAV